MDEGERLQAADEIRNLKANYCIGVDLKDAERFRSIFTQDASVDYGPDPLVDPSTGVGVRQQAIDAPSQVISGREAIVAAVMPVLARLVTVHHCAAGEIHVDSAASARATWPMVDRVKFEQGGPAREVIGYGFYHETYAREDGAWKIKTLKLTRTRVDTIAF